jgi:predicted glycoside hydrolase/deacetylase ChbG (UPF0249 family)
MSARTLVVNADDLGLAVDVNRGVSRAYDEGIVTSTSLMVRRTAATDAASRLSSRPRLAVGLHVDLGEWVYTGGAWASRYEVVDLTDERAVRDEVDRQLRSFDRLLGRSPTHLDSHQHVHRADPVREALLTRAAVLGVPVRDCDDRIRYCGAFHGQDDRGSSYPALISAGALVDLLQDLPDGWTELGVHPGEATAEWSDVYHDERAVELAALCDADVARALVDLDITLASFAELAG